MDAKNSMLCKPVLQKTLDDTKQGSTLKRSELQVQPPFNKKCRVRHQKECNLWEDLDSNILGDIFSRIPVWDVFLSVSSVCQSWEAACWDYLFWSRDVLDLSITGAGVGRVDISDAVSLVLFKHDPVPGIFGQLDSKHNNEMVTSCLLRKLRRIMEGQTNISRYPPLQQSWRDSIRTIILPYEFGITDAHLLYIAERDKYVKTCEMEGKNPNLSAPFLNTRDCHWKKPPTQSTIELSSEPELPPDHSPVSDDEDGINLSKLFKKRATEVSDVNDSDDGRDSVVNKPVKGKSPKKNDKIKQMPEKKRTNEDDSEREGKRAKGKDTNRRNTLEKHGKPHEQDHSIWSLSSDSESSPDARPVKNDKATKREETEFDGTLLDHVGKSSKNNASKVKSPMKQLEKEENDTKDNFVKEENGGKHSGPQGSSSKLPLLLSEKVQRSKALVECEGDSIDLSGDVGSVGRIVISDDPHEMFLDLKGTIYKTTIVPSRTFCVVSFGQSEAKIEAIMNDYIQLKPQSNVYEAETMVEGTLDGFSFDSEDEAEKATAKADQHEDAEEQLDGKIKGKPGKTSGPTRKKGKLAAGVKPPKKGKKKPQLSKKGKTKK